MSVSELDQEHAEEFYGEEPEAPISHFELVILCLDCSASMKERPEPSDQQGDDGDAQRYASKTDMVIDHLISGKDGFLASLQQSSLRDSYFLGIVGFDDTVMAAPVTKLYDADTGGQIHLDDDALSFLRRGGKRTAIGDGLQEAYKMAKAWLAAPPSGQSSIPQAVTIILLSDGQHNFGANPIEVANSIQAEAVGRPQLSGRPDVLIASSAYGSKANETLLRAVASTDAGGQAMYKRVHSGSELREFCIRTMAAWG